MNCELSSMDIVALVAERKIEEAMKDGAFDALTPMGSIDCSLHGERFIAKWFRNKYIHEELEIRIAIKKPGV